jgi:hypothetical protein
LIKDISRSVSTVFNHLLSCLCLADLLLLSGILLEAPLALGYQVKLLYSIWPVLHSLYHTTLTITIFCTLAITTERYQALCNPTQYRQRLRSWGQKKVLLLYLLPVIIASIILNIPQAVSVTNKGLMLESNKLYMDFLLFFQLFHPLLTSVSMSAFFLIWMNTKIFLRIKARRVRGVNKKVTRHMEVVQVIKNKNLNRY